jgi:long-chain acyl-CoA synthetase
MNFVDYLFEFVNDNSTAIITKDAKYTFLDVKKLIGNAINELTSMNIKAGDRVGILGVNSAFWIASYLAIIKLGAVAVPLSTLLSSEDLKRNLEFVDCKLIFIDKTLIPKFSIILSEIRFINHSDLSLQSKPTIWPATLPDFDENSDATLMFTSGTTSHPRAVRVTHLNLRANTESITKYLELSTNDIIMVVLPFFYCFGASLLHTHFRAGGGLVLGNSFTYPETILDLMESTQCTELAGVPSTYQILLRNSTFPNRPLPSLRKMQQAGGKLHNPLIMELIQTHPQAKVYVMYGQTEATARLSYLPPEFLQSKLGSIGKGIPEVSLKVMNEDNLPIKAGEIGEIVAFGKNISPGYLNNPEATSQKFVDGGLRTGDLATIDDDEFIYIVDRKDDFIKSYGYRISSYEIETCVTQIPDVVASAVIGIPDEIAGENIVAFVVLREESTCSAKEIILHCRNSLPKHMVPKEVVFIPALPMNAHGKVVKSELKKRSGDSLT